MGDGIKKSGSCFAKIAPQFLHLSKISPKLKGLCTPGPFKKSRPYFEPSCRNTGGAHLEVTPGFEPGNESFADSCLTTWLCHHRYSILYANFCKKSTLIFGKQYPHSRVGIACGAGNEARTRYLHLGKVALYQMSYARRWCPEPESNQRHVDFQSTALPTELSGQIHRAAAPWKWRPGTGSNRRPLA